MVEGKVKGQRRVISQQLRRANMNKTHYIRMGDIFFKSQLIFFLLKKKF